MNNLNDSLPQKLEAMQNDLHLIKKFLEENPNQRKIALEMSSTYLNLEQAIEFLKTKGFVFSKSRVYKMSAKQNGLPFKRFGARLVFVKSDLLEWCEAEITSPEKNKKNAIRTIINNPKILDNGK